MRRLIVFIGGLALATALPLQARAQGVYKSVGPDGKVVYTDQPPGSAQRHYSAPPPPPPRGAASKSAQDRTSGPRSKRATAGEPSPSGETGADADLEKAIIGALGYEDMVARTEALCVRTLPTSSGRYMDAAEGWKRRNGNFVSQARRALAADFEPTVRQLIESGVRSRNERTLSVVNEASATSRIRWCDRSAEEIAGGAMDIGGKPVLARPLLNYRPARS